MRSATITFLSVCLLGACASTPPGMPRLQTLDMEEIQFRDAKDQTVSLASLKRPVMFLAFWATACKPCLQELPAIQALQTRLAKDERVRILSINTDDKEESSASLLELLHSRAPELKLYRDLDGKTSEHLAELTGQSASLPMIALLDARSNLAIETGYKMISEEKRQQGWLDWIEIARKGRLPEWHHKQSEADKLSGQPATKNETFRMTMPEGMPPDELDGLLKGIRNLFLQRYPHLKPKQVDELMEQARQQLIQSGKIELEIPGP